MPKRQSALKNGDMVVFLAPPETTATTKAMRAPIELTRDIREVKEDWAKVTSQIGQMLEATDSQKPKGFTMDTLEISLGFSAKGKLAFIAEAGVQASVKLVFKRTSI